MSRAAIIENGQVVNVIVLPDDAEKRTRVLARHAGAVELDPEDRVGPGWALDGETFVPPVEPEPAPDTDREAKRQAEDDARTVVAERAKDDPGFAAVATLLGIEVDAAGDVKRG